MSSRFSSGYPTPTRELKRNGAEFLLLLLLLIFFFVCLLFLGGGGGGENPDEKLALTSV